MWQVQVVPLENGMTLYCHPTAANVNVSTIAFAAGSTRDPKGKTGLSHVGEHATTGRSKRYPNAREVDLLLWRYLGDADANRNIRTDLTSVAYGHGDLRRRKHMLAVFDLMASFVHPKTRIIELSRLQIEAGAVHQEYHLRGMDVMQTLLNDLMHRTMYEKNPVRNRVDCEVADLKSITLQDIKLFLRRYYVPRNASVVILGPKVEDAKALALRYFRDWEDQSIPALDYDHGDDFPKITSVRSYEIERNIGQYHLAIGFPTESYKTPDAATLDVVRNILEARLGWALRERNRDINKGAYRTPVFTERSSMHGLIQATFATTDRDFAAYGERVVLREFRKLTTDLVGHEELKSMRESILNDYAYAFENTTIDLCEMIVEAATNEDSSLEGLHSYRGELARVNRKRIREVANKYFAGRNYARVLIKPALG
jgi:predicted Zn-dependent peptidase